MTLTRRIRLYVMGLLMGTLLVVVMFNERLSVLTDWLPGNRVRQELRANPLQFSDKATCLMQCAALSPSFAERALTEGAVIFGKSSTRTEPRLYMVKLSQNDTTARFVFALLAGRTEVREVEVFPLTANCQCDKLTL